MALFDHRGGATAAGLVWWLSRNLPEETVSAEEKAPWLLACVDHLTGARGWTLDELDYRKFRLRATLAGRLKAAKQAAMRGNHQALLGREEDFQVNDRCEVAFVLGRYPYDFHYNGFTELRRHFFPDIGDLRAEGEEFRCAEFLANQSEGVRYWVRNLSAKPGMFSLQTATDRFYPDFVCLLEDGRRLAVEYKNTRDYDLPENAEKRVLGELWERRSGGRTLFIMPRGEDWAAIRRKVWADLCRQPHLASGG